MHRIDEGVFGYNPFFVSPCDVTRSVISYGYELMSNLHHNNNRLGNGIQVAKHKRDILNDLVTFNPNFSYKCESSLIRAS